MYEVIGYDRRTGEMAAEYHVPDRRVPSVLKVACVLPSHDGLGCYPLNNEQVSEISRILETPIEHDDRDFFLEPYEEPQRAAG
jgi:hypothetical protein